MALMARVSLTGAEASEPEDYLSSALSVIFPDDATNQHGDADHGVLYTSPCLPRPLRLSLTDPDRAADRSLFSHYLWNASLLLAEMVEAGSVPAAAAAAAATADAELKPKPPSDSPYWQPADFDVRGLATLELGAGTALPSMLAALFGAARVTVTDYPADVVLANLRANIARNVRRQAGGEEEEEEEEEEKKEETKKAAGPRQLLPPLLPPVDVVVDGHIWGDLDSPLAQAGYHAYDRIFVCDCLWMPLQHANLHRSIAWFLRVEPDADARCWVIAGFHTGRAKVANFFDTAALAAAGLAVTSIWERDCDGIERPWAVDRGAEDPTERKRWLVVAVLRRHEASAASKS